MMTWLFRVCCKCDLLGDEIVNILPSFGVDRCWLMVMLAGYSLGGGTSFSPLPCNCPIREGGEAWCFVMVRTAGASCMS